MADSTRSDDVEAVEADVEEARARLANTIAKLTSPATVDATKKEVTGIAQGYKDEVLQQVLGYRDGVINDVRYRVANNPLGVALIGAGIAYRLYRHPPVTTLLVGAGAALLMRGGGPGSRADASSYRAPYDRDQPRGYVPGGVAGYGYPVQSEPPESSTSERIGALTTNVEHRARDVSARVQDAAIGARDQVTDAASRASSAAHQFVDSTSERISDVASDVTHRAEDLFDTLQRNPAALGALGVAAGLALGRLARRTETGDYVVDATVDVVGRGGRVIGRGASSVASRAGSVAEGAYEAAGRAASGAGAGAADLARSVASRAPEVASSVAGAASRAAGAVAGTVTETVRGLAPSDEGEEGPGPSAARRSARSAPSRPPPRTEPRRSQRVGRLETGDWVQRRTREVANDYPLLLAAFGIAAGAAAGLALSRTETENRTLGRVADQLKDRAKEIVNRRFHDVVGAAEHLTEEFGAQAGEAQPRRPTSSGRNDLEAVLGSGSPAAGQGAGPGSTGAGLATARVTPSGTRPAAGAGRGPGAGLPSGTKPPA